MHRWHPILLLKALRERRVVWCAGVRGMAAPLLLALATSVQGAAAATIQFSDRIPLPDIGVSFQLMTGARAIPTPPPRVYRYNARQGEKTWIEERYHPLELWISDQLIGTWRDANGTTVRIATPRLAPDDTLTTGHLTRDTYNSRMETRRQTNWEPEELRHWLATFTQAPAPTLTPMNPPAMRIYRAYDVTFPAASPHQLAFLVLPRYDAPFAARHGKPWIFIDISLPPEAKAADVRSLARRNLIGSCTPLPSSILRRDSIHDFNKPTPPPLSIAKDTPAYETSKKDAHASIRNLESWWLDETRHYIILSNQRSQRRRTIDDLRDRMDRMQEAFRKMIPPWNPITEISVLRIFDDPNEYRDYVGPELDWSDGVWISNRRELVVRPASRGTDRERHDTMLRIVRHEGLHQYLFYALDKEETSPWFNEGHASLFESIDDSRRTIRPIEDPHKAALLAKAAQDGSLDATRIFNLSYSAFYTPDTQLRERNYAEAWGLIYYLRKAAPLDRPDRFSQIPGTYLELLRKSRDPETATRTLLDGIDLDALNADIRAFWTSRVRRAAALRR